MADVEIRETTVIPDANGAVVRLQISDAPLLAEDAAIRLVLTVRVPALRLPLLAHLERVAMKAADDAIRSLLQSKAQEIQETSYDLNPTLR